MCGRIKIEKGYYNLPLTIMIPGYKVHAIDLNKKKKIYPIWDIEMKFARIETLKRKSTFWSNHTPGVVIATNFFEGTKEFDVPENKGILCMIKDGMISIVTRKANETEESTSPLISEFPSLVFVWPSNCGLGILILTTAVIPSLTSSPVKLSDLSRFVFFA